MPRPKKAAAGDSAPKKAAAKMPSSQKSGDKKKRKHFRKDSYSIYIHRVLKQVHIFNGGSDFETS